MKVLYTTLIVIIIDQVSKFFVKGGTIPFLNIKANGMDYGQSINVIGDFFKITFVENPGLAFGIDVSNSSKLILSIFSLLASIGIFYYLYKSRNQKFIVRFALALILGGAIGNLIDRTFYGVIYGYAPLFYGRVVDFFNVDFFDFTIFGRTYDRWPIFNIADASVSIGVILLIIFHKSVEEKTEGEKELLATDEFSRNENLELETTNPIVKNVEDNNREEN
ncbi:MAG: signal peptidase II [Melioribacter sp.]|uniref:signal peptidase II n=1 Tax=Rosettibacter primus TaxID=3111523 RepID=UPI00247E1C62|nr:signal peptidase II [Melioribacter sp.]